MSSFILKFLNLKSRKITPYDYDRVNVSFFNNTKDAEDYIDFMCNNENYVSIEMTEYVTKTTRNTKRKNIYWGSMATHKVIGREYDNVLIPLDNHFCYSDEGKLISTYGEYYPYFEDRCVFEALTRVRKKLLLVVIDNPKLFITIQQILTWKTDKLYENDTN